MSKPIWETKTVDFKRARKWMIDKSCPFCKIPLKAPTAYWRFHGGGLDLDFWNKYNCPKCERTFEFGYERLMKKEKLRRIEVRRGIFMETVFHRLYTKKETIFMLKERRKKLLSELKALELKLKELKK